VPPSATQTTEPAWPAARSRWRVEEAPLPVVDRWPELPAVDEQESAGSEPSVDGLSTAERLRREHEGGW
jgi:hypothetical protein